MDWTEGQGDEGWCEGRLEAREAGQVREGVAGREWGDGWKVLRRKKRMLVRCLV